MYEFFCQDDVNRYYFEFVPTVIPPNIGKLNPKAMFLVRMSKVPIPIMTSLEEAEREMPRHLMYGVMHGYQLRPIHALLSKVGHR